MRRSNFLKYVSILMMLNGLVRLVFGIMMVNFFSTAITFGAIEKETMRLAQLTAAVLCVGALADVICGFIGAVRWDEPLLAGSTSRWGLAALALGIAGNILQAGTGYGLSYVTWTTGLVIPALFLTACLSFLLRSRKQTL